MRQSLDVTLTPLGMLAAGGLQAPRLAVIAVPSVCVVNKVNIRHISVAPSFGARPRRLGHCSIGAECAGWGRPISGPRPFPASFQCLNLRRISQLWGCPKRVPALLQSRSEVCFILTTSVHRASRPSARLALSSTLAPPCRLVRPRPRRSKRATSITPASPSTCPTSRRATHQTFPPYRGRPSSRSCALLSRSG